MTNQSHRKVYNENDYQNESKLKNVEFELQRKQDDSQPEN